MKTAEEYSIELVKMTGASDKEVELCKKQAPDELIKVQAWIQQP